MPVGKIKFCKPEKKFGFIEHPDYPKNLHFHLNECHGWIPRQGDECKFEIGTGRDGEPVAKRIRNTSAPKVANSSYVTETAFPSPFNFIEVKLDLAVTDEPVWHDGQHSKERFTGRLSITLSALTPLIVGNEHYSVKDTPAPGAIRIGNNRMPDDKKIIEPLRLPDGRVALTGGSLNGMIRHSLGALLSAPMERVAERVFSYRPNINGLRPNQDTYLEARPAIIEAWDGEDIKIKVLPDLQCVYFSKSGFEQDYYANPSLYPLGRCFDIPNAKVDTAQRGNLEKRYIDHHHQPLKDWRLFSYVGGLDACGILNRLFSKNPNAHVHRLAAVPNHSFQNSKPNKISHDCIQHYISTLEHLGNDKTGHLADHPLLNTQTREEKAGIQAQLKGQIDLWQNQSPHLVNRLIFVEIDKNNGKITSFGHNFLYRWRYADSVRLQNNANVRDILKPCQAEQVAENSRKHIAPEQLSGARMLCGYVSARSDKPWLNEGSDNIGKGRYQRLKGRINCNFAIEYWANANRPDDIQRFLPGIDNEQFFIPLKPLGKPRTSAEVSYLLQPQDGEKLKQARNGDRAGLRTYGDLPGVDTPGELAGRKFYQHQPNARDDKNCYVTQDQEYISGKSASQSSLARYVSRPDTEFRFTLQCNDLRRWEIGALLVTLEPCKYFISLVNELVSKDPARFGSLKQKQGALFNMATKKQQPLFAHKLGLARPLGLGSVLLNIDKIEKLADDCDLPAFKTITETDPYIAACADKLSAHAKPEDLAKHLESWAANHRYAGLTRAAYPEATNRSGEATIFNHYSIIRRKHMEQRRLLAGKSSNIVEPAAFQPLTLPESSE